MPPIRISDGPTLVDHLRRRATEMPDRRAFTFLQDGEREIATLTYGDLDRRARILGARLQSSLAPTSRVLLLLPQDLEFVVGFLGCLYAGVLPVPAYPPQSRRRVGRLAALAQDAMPHGVLTTESTADRIRLVTADLDALENATWFVTETRAEEAPEGWRPPRIPASELAFLQYTSGSTGNAKGVSVSHANLLHAVEAIRVLAETTEETVIVGWLPLYHDMGLIANVLHSLYVGAYSVQMSPTAFLQRPRRWFEAITRYRATASGGPDFAYDLCHRRIRPQDAKGLDLSSWRIAFDSAEPVRARVLQRFAMAFAGVGFHPQAFLPCYGLAEATLLVAGARPGGSLKTRVLSAEALEKGRAEPGDNQEKQRELVCCGRPVLGTTLRVVDPVTSSPLPEGYVGEIWVRGPSICSGYWNRPEDSAQVFSARLDSGSEESDGAFLRTGDLGFLDHGQLYVTGRLRDLLIIRGRNHFPQDLEASAEAAHPTVQAAVAFSVDLDDQLRLVIVAELQRRTAVNPEAVTAAVRSAIALEHEVQVFDVVLTPRGAIPRTTSGKVRRFAAQRAYLNEELAAVYHSKLSPHDLDAEGDLTALSPWTLEPLNEEEAKKEKIRQVVRNLAANVLRLPPYALSDDRPLATHGLDSLLAAQLSAEIESALGAPVEISQLFEDDIATLAECIQNSIENRPSVAEPELRPGLSVESGRVLSFGEERLWFFDRLEPGGSVYNLPARLKLTGNLDVQALQEALSEICRRHEPLRTFYTELDGNPVANILGPAPHPLPVVDLISPAGPNIEIEHLHLAALESTRPFNLGEGPLLRTCLIRIARDVHWMLVTIHHIAADGFSVALFLRELAALYTAFSEGKSSPLPELPLRYADFAVWQREMLQGERLDRALRYWREQLEGAPALLELPLDHPRQPSHTFKAASRAASASSRVRIALESLAAAEGTTLFVLSLAVFGVLLRRHSNTSELVVGTPVAGRYHRETENLIGFFVNMLPLRVEADRHLTFRDFLRSCRNTVLSALDHQILPFERMVEELQPKRSLDHSPLFQVSFALETSPFESQQVELGSLVLELQRAPASGLAFDLQASVMPIGDRLEMLFEYDRHLFDATTIQRLTNAYRRLLVSAAEFPDLRLGELPMLDVAELAQLTLEWNDTATAFPSNQTVHGLLEEVTRRDPDAIAVVFGCHHLTYGELERRSGILGRRLIQHRVGPDQPVAVSLPRSLDLVVALVGVLRAGGAYVPLDLSYPRERLQYMLEDSGAAAIIATEPPEPELEDELPWIAPPGAEAEDPAPPLQSFPKVAPDNLAYVMYTSGSTGRPKGVAVPHTAVCRLVRETNYLRIRPSDHCVQLASIAFDSAIFEVWGALLNGATVVVAEKPPWSAQALAELLSGARLTTLFLTTALFHMTAEEDPSAFGTLETLIIGGEQASSESIQRVLRTGGPRRLINAYGPTESTTFATTHRCDQWLGGRLSPPIGRPISNTRTYVVDETLELAPIGIPGELLLGGDGLARGYLARPGLTAERFVPDALSGREGGRLYRTGDRVRQRADGVLDFQGRLDAQVKVRGFRIELGEIEARFSEFPEVRDALVVARKDRTGGRRLVAYVVLDESAHDTPRGYFQEALARELPEYMIPTAVVELNALPLTPNGKVDRRALPDPEVARSTASVAPRTPVEEAIASIWSEVLGIERVGVHDDFFELGGHSLLVAKVTSRVRQALAVELPLRQFFEVPTVAALARAIEDASGKDRSERPPIRPLPRAPGASFSLSLAQERLWYFEKLFPDTAVYHIPAAFRLRGPLDVASLRFALGQIVARHESLRTRFPSETLEAEQRVDPAEPAQLWQLPVIDLSGLRPDVRRIAVAELLQQEARRPFDFEAGGLLRTLLLRRELHDHELCIVLHHLVADGWSVGIFLGELSTFYNSNLSGATPQLPPIPIQMADFAVWQREHLAARDLEEDLATWRKVLHPMESVLELPADRPSPVFPTHRGGTWDFELPSTTTAELQKISRREGVTLYMAFAALYLTLLARVTGTPYQRFGTPIAGRSRRELEDPIGLFVRTLIVSVETDLRHSFRDLLRDVRARMLEAYAHQDLFLEGIPEELGGSPTATNLVQVFFAFNQPVPPLELEGLQVEHLPLSTATAKFDLSLALSERPNEGFRGELEYSSDLFDATSAGRLAGYFVQLLRSAIQAPEVPLFSLTMLSTAQRAQLTWEWNDVPLPPPAEGPPAGIPGERRLHTPFVAQATRNPDAVALVWRDQRLSYRELNERSSRLAIRLQKLGVEQGGFVGVLLDRDPFLIVSLLAVLKAGAAYLPLDPAYPLGYLATMIADSGTRVIIGHPDRLRAGREVGDLKETCSWVDPEEWEKHLGVLQHRGVSSDDPAYLLFTSGTTGRPKGVVVTHRNALALVDWAATVWSPQERQCVLAATSISFDLSVYEIFFTLAAGGRIVLVESALALEKEPAKDEVTLINTVPSAAAELLRQTLPTGVRAINLAGEALPRSLANELLDGAPQGTRVCNLYGPTETTTYDLFSFLDRRDLGMPSIGRPVAGSRAYVLGDWLEQVPPGSRGHLFLAGAGLSNGYWGRPSLTAASFLPNPAAGINDPPGSRVYRTGDVVRQSGDGQLYFLGRADQQVKVRGFRVEPYEVEAAILELPEVVSAAVVVVSTSSPESTARLAAAVVLDPNAGSLSAADIGGHLAEKLPSYFLPKALLFLPELPLTSTGKIDRQAITRMAWRHSESGVATREPRTPIEEIIVPSFTEVLDTPSVGIDSNFFALGGDSILSVRLVAILRKHGLSVKPRDLFKAPTPAQLARQIAENGQGEEALEFKPRDPDQAIPASFSQNRLWLLDSFLPDPTAYSLSGAIHLRGPLQLQRLLDAIWRLGDRHEVLRTRFVTINEQPFQVIDPSPPGLELPIIDLRNLSPQDQDRTWQNLVTAGRQRRFDLSRGPLLRLTLVRRAADDHQLLAFFHHIIADARSIEIFGEELTTLYSGTGERPESLLAPLEIGYAEFALRQSRWLHTPAHDIQLDFWLRQLESSPPLLELPADRPRPRGLSSRGACCRMPLDISIAQDLRALARNEKATLFMALFAGFAALLHRYSGMDDLVVGIPVSGRTHPKLEPLIGYFDNTLALRSRLDARASFRRFLRATRELALEAFAHSELPFDEVVSRLRPDRAPSHPPVVQILFSVQQDPARSWTLGDLEAEVTPLEPTTSRLDLTVALLRREEALEVYAEFSADLFDGSTIERLLRHLGALLSAASVRPDTRVVGLPLLSATEREQILYRWNRSQGHRPGLSSVAELIRRRVRARPNALAVEAPDGRLTFAQLQLTASSLAERLRSLGAAAESLVVVHAHRSAALVVGQLAAWTAGAAFLSVDPNEPRGRRLDLVTQANPVAVLSQIGLEEIPGVETIFIDLSKFSGQSLPDPIPAAELCPENLAYVVFTSGAEGRPKGVSVTHEGLLNLIFWHLESYDLNPSDRMALIASPEFDASVWEIWPHLVAGATLCVPDEGIRLDPVRLLSWIQKRSITRVFLPTALAELVLAETPGPDFPLRTILTGGDQLHRRPLPGQPFEVFNHYGPTEASVVATAARVAPTFSGEVLLLPPIGRPITNTEAYVLDENLEPVPLGVAGELYLGGLGLARCYLDDPMRSALSFLPNPFGRRPGQRLYRTGDIVRFRQERSLEFLHRRDQQVQVQGFRVELSGIEAVINQHPAVQESTVLAISEGSRKILVAFVVLVPKPLQTNRRFLRAFLVERLPFYMVPSLIEILERIPRDPRGKIDRQRLLQTYLDTAEGLELVPPSTQTQKIVLRVWKQVLEAKTQEEISMGVADNFFRLGGDSLSASQAAATIKEIFGGEVTTITLQQYPTVADFAMFLDGGADQALALAQAAEIRSRGGDESSPTLAERTAQDYVNQTNSSADKAAPEQSPPTARKTRAFRHVNVWLEDEPPVILGLWHHLGVDIGTLREQTLLDHPFTEPGWGGREELELSLSLAGQDIDVETSPQRAVLRRSGSLEPLIFRICPRRTGTLDLYLSIYLYRAMTLLMRMELTIEVVAPEGKP